MHEHDCKHRVWSELRLYLESATSRSEDTRVLIRGFGETQEIEFVQSNYGQSHAALQTYHFPPISRNVLFMRAHLVWTLLHWYSTQSLIGLSGDLGHCVSFIYLHLEKKNGRRWWWGCGAIQAYEEISKALVTSNQEEKGVTGSCMERDLEVKDLWREY